MKILPYLFLTVLAASTFGVESIDFAREILPILSNKCYACHGPDTKKKDDLRLDSYEAATEDRGGYRAIDPEAPGKSEFLARIHDKEDPMPPKDAEQKLTATERALLDRWVRQGGEYAQHWAFVPPKRETTGSIDAFIQAKLGQQKLAPAADSATLARRAALVLTGLPPEPEQLAAFLADSRLDAYERFVDELLASPRYGEHQARYWLDAVRYGDTHGLHLDNRRGIYPYRDWVVRALNNNLSLDDFLIWQLAGDLLPEPTLEQLVATGFVRMNPSTAEGGVIPAEFQAKNNFDRVETLGTVLLGMTLSCARCHSHKYDPIPQQEYYKLMAFFNSTAESPLDGNAYIYGPVAHVPSNPADLVTWQQSESDRKALLAETAAEFAKADVQAKFLAHAKTVGAWTSEPWELSKPVAFDAGPPSKDWRVEQKLPGKAGNLQRDQRATWAKGKFTLPADHQIWITYSGAPGSQLLVDGKVIHSVAESASNGGTVPLAMSVGSHEILVKMVGSPDRFPLELQLDDPWQALAKAGKWSNPNEDDRLRMLADPASPLANAKARELMATRGSLQRNFTTTLIARDLPKPRETRMLRRGEYNLPTGDPLQPDVFSIMGNLPEDAPRNRLGLAKWLTADQHPLVARVLVNGIWQRVFGHGLVRTPEDFGRQGQQPTHPELLDFLAVSLQDSGWDLKAMLRRMVTSATFRQSSAWRAELDDPDNQLFARGPRHRLDAEVLRDLALWSSGLLDPRMGGEGVKPYQPAGMWMAMAHPASNTKKYERDHGKRLYRRSLYVYWKRTSPHPMMTLFDAPDRESSCVRRSRSNTPLQSLGLLNETQRVEMARALGERLIGAADSDADRLDALFGMLACRPPNAAERAACQSLLDDQRQRFATSEADAQSLLSIGDAARADLPLAEHAAWTQLAATVLASDTALLLY
jgi:hypothetical protein